MFFRFEHGRYLFLLFVLPLFLLMFILAFRDRKKTLKSFGDLKVINQLMPDISNYRIIFKYIILQITIVCIIFAIAGPQFGSKLKEIKREGIEIIIALDVSNSMLAEDIKPNRLERTKQAISNLIDKLENDKIGLIIFAGDAYPQIPLTTDYSSAKMFLSNISTNMVSKQGTAIGSSIELATKSFDTQTKASKVIVVISDGENHEGDAILAAKNAAEKGIKIFTIGIGLAKGVPIPTSDNPYLRDYRRDKQGNIIMTRLNVRMLTEIANAGNGKYYAASTTRVGLNDLFNKLDKLEKDDIKTKEYSEYEEQFPYLVWIALIALILEILLFDRKSRWLKKINIFKV